MQKWYQLAGFVILVTLSLSACSNLEPVETTDEFGNVLKYQRDKDTFAKGGWFYRYEANGAPVEAAQYQNDTLHGMRILFYANGDTSIVENYKEGSFHGQYRVYYENGELKQLGEYKENQPSGEWLLYFENGQLREKVILANGEENGPFTEYHENGNLAAEGFYKDGDNEDGELKVYDENGELIRKMDCDLGRCTTIWRSESEKNKDEAAAAVSE